MSSFLNTKSDDSKYKITMLNMACKIAYSNSNSKGEIRTNSRKIQKRIVPKFNLKAYPQWLGICKLPSNSFYSTTITL
jgi:hypothetical protein